MRVTVSVAVMLLFAPSLIVAGSAPMPDMPSWSTPTVTCLPPGVPAETVRQGLQPTRAPQDADLGGARQLPVQIMLELRRHNATGASYAFAWFGGFLIAVDDDPYGPGMAWIDTGTVRQVATALMIRAEPKQACTWERRYNPEHPPNG